MADLAALLGESRPIEAVREQIRQLLSREARARHLPTILLQGETGTGKGLLARLIHDQGARRAGPFVDVNCAAIPDTLLEAELFGFAQGAFTGARQAKPGLFHAARGGTLFLDEVGLLPEPLQAKLLKAIDERAIRPLGSSRTELIDVRLIAATNLDLAAAVRSRRFREDVYHRLAVVTVQLPPLRECRGDVIVLARHFIARWCADYHLPAKTFSMDALAALRTYPWPGNVRELSNLIERVCLFAEDRVIGADLLRLPAGGSTPLASTPAGLDAGTFDEAVTEVERQKVLQALEVARWNVTRAALRLGISRDRLRYRIDRLGLRRGRSIGGSKVPTQPAAEPHDSGPVPLPTDGAITRPGLHWERRYIALLRADLIRSAGSDGTHYAARAITTIVEKLQSFGGRVQDVGRATVVAAFGLDPVDNAATAAAHAAVALQRAATRALQMEPRAPTITLAIHVGQVTVAYLGDGPEIDLESKHGAWATLAALIGAGDSRGILVSQATAPFLERRFELYPAGKPDGTLPRYYRLGRREHTGFGLGGRTLTRFVGRQRELDLLTELLARAEGGQGQVVAVTGEPGLGKSRVVYELSNSSRLQGWRTLRCGGESFGGSIPWLPIVELLRRYLQLTDADSVSQVEMKVADAMSSTDEVVDRSPILALLDVPFDDAQWQALDPPQRRSSMIETVVRLLLQQSRAEPVLLIVEDLQWVDGETRALLDRLIECLPMTRMLLLVTYRPEFRHDWGSKTFYTQLPLGPLPFGNAAELLEALMGKDPALDPLRELLIQRTDGNPFFLEESVWDLVESGALVGEPGAWRLARPMEVIDVPATVQDVIGARIDRLPPEEKQLLQAAAVIGKDVPYAILAAIADQPEEARRRGLAHLQEAEFLYETRLFPDLEYTFKHALTHEVTYGSLLGERRHQLHAQIVAAMEQLYGDRLAEHVERLGQHALRGEVWEKAVLYLHQAGVKASDRSVDREAVALLEQALGALEHVPDGHEALARAVDLRLSLSAPVATLGDLRRALAILGNAERVARELGDPRRLGWVSGALAGVYAVRAEYAKAIEHGERGRESGRLTGETGVRVVSAVYLGVSHQYSGRLQRATEYYREALALLEGGRRHERYGMRIYPASHARNQHALCLAELGEFGDAIRLAQEGWEIAEEVGHAYTRSQARLNSAWVYLLRGELDRAISAAEQAVRLAQEAESALVVFWTTGMLGAALIEGGRAVEGVPLLEQAVETALAQQIMLALSRWVNWLADGYFRVGRRDEALEQAHRALDIARAQSERGSEAWALRRLGEIHVLGESADADTAEDWYRQALTLATELGKRPLLAHCHLGLGRLYRRTGRREQAHEHLTTAATMYCEMDMGFWLTKAEAELAALS